MWRVLFLILVLSSVAAYPQTEEPPMLPSESLEDFGPVSVGDIRGRLDNFLVVLLKEPAARGYVVNYGSAREIAWRAYTIRNHIRLRNFDAARITFVRGGLLKEIRTQLWILPSGVASPPLIPTASKVDEFGALSEKSWRARFDKILLERKDKCDEKIHVIIYARKIAADVLTKKYLDYAVRKECRPDSARIAVAKGKFAKKQKTEIWIVPPGAETPTT